MHAMCQNAPKGTPVLRGRAGWLTTPQVTSILQLPHDPGSDFSVPVTNHSFYSQFPFFLHQLKSVLLALGDEC